MRASLVYRSQGRSCRETADLLGVSAMTVSRWWRAADQGWLEADLSDDQTPAPCATPSPAPPPELHPRAPRQASSCPPPRPARVPLPTSAPAIELDPPAGASASALQQARDAADAIRAVAEQARQSGNHTAAQRALRDLGATLAIVARLEKLEGSDGDSIRVLRSDIHAAESSLRAKLQRLTAQPLTCDVCGRALRAQWGEDQGAPVEGDSDA